MNHTFSGFSKNKFVTKAILLMFFKSVLGCTPKGFVKLDNF